MLACLGMINFLLIFLISDTQSYQFVQAHWKGIPCGIHKWAFDVSTGECVEGHTGIEAVYQQDYRGNIASELVVPLWEACLWEGSAQPVAIVLKHNRREDAPPTGDIPNTGDISNFPINQI